MEYKLLNKTNGLRVCCSVGMNSCKNTNKKTKQSPGVVMVKYGRGVYLLKELTFPLPIKNCSLR